MAISGAVAGAAGGAAIGSSILPGWGTAIGGLIGGAIGFFGGPKKKQPPPPPGYVSYDDEGNLAGSMVWEGDKYVYRAGQLSQADRQYYDKINKLRMDVLGNLDKTPADREKAYAEYRQRVGDFLQRDVDLKYREDVRGQEETMAARGMFGSRAYADTMGLMSREKRRQDLDVSDKAFFGGEALAQQDFANWMQQLGFSEDANRFRKNYGLAREQNALAGVGRSQTGSQASWNQGMQGELLQDQQQQQFNDTLLDTSGGLAYLYGLGGKKTSSGGGQSPGVTLDPSRYAFQGVRSFYN